MIETSVKTSDVNEIIRILDNLPGAVQEGLSDVAKTMRTLAQGRTPFKTGHAKRSWGQIEAVARGFSFTNPVDYINTLESGLYPRVGPRTVAFGDGIYSRQAPGGILEPLVSDGDVLKRVTELVASELERLINRAGA